MDQQILLPLKRKISLILSNLIDDNIWVIKETDEKLETIYFNSNFNQLISVFSEDFLRILAKEFPERHSFIFHMYSSYIYRINNSILEPTYGWIILRKYFVFQFSFPLVKDPWRPKPTLPSYLKFTLGNSKMNYLEDAISIRFGWENYYHFFIDVLGQIFILELKGIPLNIPIVVPYYFDSISYVKEFLSLSSFIKRKIIIQQKYEYYQVKNLIVSKDTFVSEGIKEVILSLDYLRESKRNDKIFLYRPLAHGRSIVNLSEIIQMAETHGFMAIDSSNLTLKEQIALFSGVSHLVGIHGAGLTNIIFRYGFSLSLLEIFPDVSLTPEHYKNLSTSLSFDYSSIIGENADEKFNFHLDSEKLNVKLKDFCHQFKSLY